MPPNTSQPRAFVVNWMDRDLASYDRAMESLQQVFGRGAMPLQLPIGSEKGFRGVVDLIAMKALTLHAGRRRQSESRRNSRSAGRPGQEGA